MIKVLATPNETEAEIFSTQKSSIGVGLYHGSNNLCGSIGHQLMEKIKTCPQQPSLLAWDFLSLALAVRASDKFIPRRTCSEDGWSRIIDLRVRLADPEPFIAVKEDLENALQFLSGDIWRLVFFDSGISVPVIRKIKPFHEDSVCLFSGGMDSLIGTIDLLSTGQKPVLVSHSERMASGHQLRLKRKIGQNLEISISHFYANSYPQISGDTDDSARTRSFLYLAYGILIASSLINYQEDNSVNLFIPENGFISLNPPLTPQRYGSLSTRTTHPYFIYKLQSILDQLDCHVSIINPYKFKTKGEMITETKNPDLLNQVIFDSFSCGKGQRITQHCGRCVPCLIRRSAFNYADLVDHTMSGTRIGYLHNNLSDLNSSRDLKDVNAFRFAIKNYQADEDLKNWLLKSAPFSFCSHSERTSYISLIRRGLAEVENFLTPYFE